MEGREEREGERVEGDERERVGEMEEVRIEEGGE